MDIFNFSINQIERFIIVLIRVSGIIMMLPILGSRSVPIQTRIGLSFVLSLIILPLLTIRIEVLLSDIFSLIPVLAGELMIGMIIGFASRIVFTAIELGGMLIGFQMGFGIVNILDPQTSQQVPIIGQFQTILATLIFLTINGHYYFISAIMKSFQIIPPISFYFSSVLMENILRIFNQVFIIAVKISAPITIVILLTNVLLGLISRTLPQMNVFIVGYPLIIGMGLLILGFSLPLFSMFLRNVVFTGMNENMFTLMRIMGSR
ncbi:MAG: flagellar biosynthetic protein FliR [Nitrospirota bacterium]